MKREEKQILIRVPGELRKKFRIMLLYYGVSMNEFLESYISEVVQDWELSRKDKEAGQDANKDQ